MGKSKTLHFVVTGALLIGSATGCGSSPSDAEEPFLNIRGPEETDPEPGVCCVEGEVGNAEDEDSENQATADQEGAAPEEVNALPEGPDPSAQ